MCQRAHSSASEHSPVPRPRYREGGIITIMIIIIMIIIIMIIIKVVPPCVDAQAAPHDDGHEPVFEDQETTFLFIGTTQAKCQIQQRAAAAQQLRALLVVAEPQLQRRELKRAVRQHEAQL